jgi:AcrR family transcriptional regulator
VSETISWTPKARAVLDAASELFYERGIHAVGVDVIAARAGVTKKTLYDRFGSKDRLVVEYLRARDLAWRALVQERLDQVGPEPRDRVAAIFDVTASWARERGPKGCAMVNAHAEISDPAHPAYAVMADEKRWLLELFRGLAASAGAEDPVRTGGALMLLHEGAVVAAGMRAVDDAYATAAAAAADLLP